MSNHFPHIIHIDGDAFFASCEEAMDYRLKGKPVVVGQERGIATALNAEAKRMGVVRGLPIFQVKKMCPSCVILSGNHRAYSIFSMRMARIAKRFASVVERYSIDECFADIALDAKTLDEAVQIATKLQQTLREELGITFSLGLAPTKTLAKIASKWNKPNGFTVIESSSIASFLSDRAVEEVWGIGPALAHKLKGLGVMTALAFAEKNPEWVLEHTPHKHERSLWHELRGEKVSHVDADFSMPSSTQAFRSFRATNDHGLVYAHLVKNTARATERLRHLGLFAQRVTFHVRDKARMRKSIEIILESPSSNPEAFLEAFEKRKHELLLGSVLYTQTGVSLFGLSPHTTSNNLFGEEKNKERWRNIYTSVDALNKFYGSGTMVAGASMTVRAKPKKEIISLSEKSSLDAHNLAMPYLGEIS